MTKRLSAFGFGLALLGATAACDRPAAPSVDAPVPAATPAAPTTETAPSTSLSPEGARPAPVEAAAPTPQLVVTDAQVEAEYSGGLQKCLNGGDAAKGVSVAMGGCFNTELQAQDARLNSAYRAVMGGLDDRGRARLRTEELAWIRQRDAGCREAATGGTIDRVEIPSCLLTETVRRRLVLEAMARQS